MRFCDIEKVGIVCDTYLPKTEKRRDAEVKVVRLTLRIEPLTLEVAGAIDGLVKRMLFRGSGEPVPFMHDVTFALDTPRQQPALYASRDTKDLSQVFDQVAISHVRAYRHGVGWALKCKATFGPCGPADLGYINEWFGTQRFVTFEQAQPDLFDGAPDAPDDEPDVDGGELAPAAAPAPRRARGTTH